jgi:hypothetical protein
MADSKVASQQTHLPPDPDGLGGGLDHPEVEDTAGLGGWVWIVLFGSVMSLSIVANLLMISCVLFNRKKHSVVYFLLILMFLINLVDYSLLIFEFSLGMGHEYPYGESACTLYQISVRGNPILQATAVIILLHYAAGFYCNLESPPRSSSGRSETTVTCSRTNNLVIFFTILTGLLVAEALFSVPTACFATIVTVDSKHYCEIDLAAVAPEGSQQKAISIFYLLYSAIFSYWLPLLVRIIFETVNQLNKIVIRTQLNLIYFILFETTFFKLMIKNAFYHTMNCYFVSLKNINYISDLFAYFNFM